MTKEELRCRIAQFLSIVGIGVAIWNEDISLGLISFIGSVYWVWRDAYLGEMP